MATTAGGIEGTKFTAPSNAASATVSAIVHGEGTKVDLPSFNVLEPTGVDHAVVTNLYPYPTNSAGAGMQLIVYMKPTAVSFYRVMMEEVGEDATNVQGYFTNNPPFDPSANISHKGSTAPIDLVDGKHHGKGDDPFKLNWDNSWDHGWDNAKIGGIPNPCPGYPVVMWSSGQFTWNVPWKWWVDGSTNTNSMSNGWQQVFTIDASGTMTVSKFGHTVTRTVSQSTGTAK